MYLATPKEPIFGFIFGLLYLQVVSYYTDNLNSSRGDAIKLCMNPVKPPQRKCFFKLLSFSIFNLNF